MSDTPRTDALRKEVSSFEYRERFSAAIRRCEEQELENAALRAQLTAGPDKTLRCAFCGEPYPEGTPTHKHETLAAHVRVCSEHPVGKENRELRDELRRVGQSLREAAAMIRHFDNTLYPGWTNLSREDIRLGMQLVEKRTAEEAPPIS